MKRTRPLTRKQPLRARGGRLPGRSPRQIRKRARSLRKTLWPEFSRLIRARDKTCQFAGYFGAACGGSLQAAHLYPKGKYPLLELHPLNVVAACYVCHLFGWHKSPLDAKRWWERHLSADWQAQLELAQETSLSRKGMTEAMIRSEWRAYGLGGTR